MPKKRLTDSFIRNTVVSEEEGRVEYYDTVITGMAIRVSKSGTKSFIYKYRHAGKSKRHTFAKFPMTSLAEARKIAKDLKYKVSQGIDLNYEKKKKLTDHDGKITFRELANQFIKGHLPSLAESTSKEYKRILRKELEPKIGDFLLEDISKRHLIDLLDSIAVDRGKKTLSNRVEAVLSSVLSFAVGKAYIDINPVFHIRRKIKEKSRDRFYSDNEIKILWGQFNEQREPIASLFKFLLLTGQRKGETLKAEWKDIDLNNRIWTIRSADTKNSKTHSVPLSELACGILLNLKDNDSEYVFKSPRKETHIKWVHKATERIKKDTGIIDFRPHDLRRTVMTKMAELRTPQIVIGKLLNHSGLAGDNTVTAIYNRYDYLEEKQKAVKKWSEQLKVILSKKED